MKQIGKYLTLISCFSLLFSCKQEKKTTLSDEIKPEEHNYYCPEYSNPTNVYTVDGRPFTLEVADPSIVKGDDGLFYCFATDRRTFVSEDGVEFYDIGYEIINWPTWQEKVIPDAHYYMWAPDVIKIGENWIYYYSFGTNGKGSPGIGYGVASTCAGPYVDKGPLFTYKDIDDVNGVIDPQVFYDKDGELHMVYGSFHGIYIVDLEDDGMSLKEGKDGKGNKTLIAGKRNVFDRSTYEGSYIIYKDGYYYYFGSVGTCCDGKNSTYTVYVARSENVKGPYVGIDNKPLTLAGGGTSLGNIVLYARPSFRDTVVGPGHNSIYKDDRGDYWIYYHAYSVKDNFKTRHLFIDKLIWDKNGYPYVDDFSPTYNEIIEGPAQRID